MSELYLTTPQNSLFDDERLPLRPYCTDDLEVGLRIRGRNSALKLPYIQVNPPKLKFWMIFDVDRPASGYDWDKANLPMPAWVSQNRENGHCHMAWGLSAPVLTSEAARLHPMRYLAAIESAYRAKLEADIGYSGLITKNPLNKRWLSYVGDPTLHEMSYLADWVDLPKHTPKQGVKVEHYGLGRNCSLFEQVRHWSYRAIRDYRPLSTSVWNDWVKSCVIEVQTRNSFFPTPLQHRECYHIGFSIAKWVWRRDKAAELEFRQRQAWKGKKGGMASGQSRLAASENQRATARLMSAKGMSQRAIAQELGVSVGTINTWVNQGVQ